jgi:squalene synthase HpnC
VQISQRQIESGYAKALSLAKSHYENFPVVSVFIPKELRKHVAVIYWFARTADDFADDETLSAEVRMQLLTQFEEQLKHTVEGNPSGELDAALLNTINERKITAQYLFDLLSAFKQDIVKTGYSSMDELLDYCRRSANPVGRLMLELFGLHNKQTVQYSDKICSALQLTNFWQDVSIDIKKERIYVPQDYLYKFAVTEDEIARPEKTGTSTRKFKNCVHELVNITDEMFLEGELLIPFLNGIFKYEISWTVLGGRKVLDKIRKIDYNVHRERVRLSKFDLLQLGIASFFYGSGQRK